MWIRRSHFATQNLTNESHGGRMMAAKWNVKKRQEARHTHERRRRSHLVPAMVWESEWIPATAQLPRWRWQVYWDRGREKPNDFNLQCTSASACSLLSADTRHFASSPPVSTLAWHSAPAICHETPRASSLHSVGPRPPKSSQMLETLKWSQAALWAAGTDRLNRITVRNETNLDVSHQELPRH